MPGIVGFTHVRDNRDNAKLVLERMRDMITYESFYSKDELYCDDTVCATRSHTNISQKETQPHSVDGIHIWMDGELYNREQIAPNAESDTDFLSALYRQDRSFRFLEDIDGVFSAAIYDSNRQQVHLITDRYGMRQLYWTVHNGQMVWSSELKALLALPDFRPKIGRLAVEQFMEIGYLLENDTWFEDVKLVPSGTVMTWDVEKQTYQTHRYWWWDRIKPASGKLDEAEISAELSRLFTEAVERRCKGDEPIGLTLSGGLDSRAILAAVPDVGYSVHAITFGKKGSADIRIAAKAAALKGAVHCTDHINEDNWLMPRLSGIWWTDGHLDLMHMHGIESRMLIRDNFRINLNGFAGDLICGGSYLKDIRYLDHPVDTTIAAKMMGCSPELVPDLDGYSNLNKTDFYFLQNRVRRFTYCGTRHSLTSIEHRKPFYDNQLVEFVYSLPDDLRYGSRIYKAALLQAFPEYFKRIPWQKTGVPITQPQVVQNAVWFTQRVKNRLRRTIAHLGVNLSDPNNYTDYPNWIRKEPAKSFFARHLLNDSAFYPEYIQRDQVIDEWESHVGGQNHAAKLCRYLTFEIWLQQVFEKNLLDGCYHT